jgi:hypothetical protein
MYPSPFGLNPYLAGMNLAGMNLAGMQLGYDPSLAGVDELSLGAAAARHPLAPVHHAPAHPQGAAAHLQQVHLQQQLAQLTKQQALMNKAMTHLQPNEQTQVLPFPKGEGGSTSVLAGALATVSARPQRPFQTQRFAWPSTTSGFFDIILFTVGQENMMVQAGAVSAEIFAQTGVGVSLSGYIAYPGIEITLQVQNTDTLPHPIQAAIVGSALV